MARDGIDTTNRAAAGRAGLQRGAPMCLAFLLVAAAASPALADDLDVYRAALDAQRKPNVLFLLDYSGSMAWDVDGNDAQQTGKPARIDILKQAVKAVVDNNLDNANFGIGSIYGTAASGVRWPVTDMRDDAAAQDANIPPGRYTNRDVLLSQLDRLPARGWTSTVNALAEASAYFQAEPLSAAMRSQPDRWNEARARHDGGRSLAALPTSYTAGNRYDSPAQSCQVNAVILVSDGSPTRRNDTPRLRRALSTDTAACEDLSTSIFAENSRYPTTGNCGPEIAARMASPGNIPGVPEAVVKTFTIGFAIDGPGARYLDKVARAGDGTAETAGDLQSLTDALESFFPLIDRGNQSFSGLSVNVNRASFSHEQRAFYNLFEPSRYNAWQGNLKGYFLSPTGLNSLDGTAATELKDGIEVFKTEAQSFWSAAADGNDVLLGGSAEQLPNGAGSADAVRSRADNRTLYTYLGERPSGAPIALAGNAAHLLSSANSGLAAGGLGLPRNARARNALIDRLRAAPMGDPLHSQAVGIDYPDRKVVYSMTNQGLLHAFDTTRPVIEADGGSGDSGGGEELWAFMPKRLLANLPALASNARNGEHVYGLDGGITRWHDDTDADGVVDANERLLLVFGMRRGGNSYYAMDVSDPAAPRLVWEINPDVAGFERLGETWSRPALVTAASGSAEGNRERFLILGGGYDAAAVDGKNEPVASRGNAVFVVDEGGNPVWSVDGGDVNGMRHAMPSDPTVIDVDGDGLADRLYIGDLGGQVWRIDFADMRKPADYAVTRLARLAAGSHQPFFYPPSVAYHRVASGDFLSVSLGSGNRADPMRRDSGNRFYMLRDTDVTPGAPVGGFETIRSGKLYDATPDRLGSRDAAVAERARKALEDARGWRIDLEAGEKSLSASVSFDGRLLATTFEPTDTIPANACAPVPIGRYYAMDILTGRPMSASSATSDPTARYSRLGSNGIPGTPRVVFPKGAKEVSIAVDKQIVTQFAQGLSRVFWHAR